MKKINPVELLTEDICFQTKDNRRFRLRAAAIIIENKSVLFAKNDSADYYYSIGGGIQLGESIEEAVKREVLEETGVSYEIDRLAFVHECFFKRLEKTTEIVCHEITFYFLMKARGSQTLNSYSISEGLPEHMCWLPVDKLADYDVYPKFFIEKLKNLKNYPEHIVSRLD